MMFGDMTTQRLAGPERGAARAAGVVRGVLKVLSLDVLDDVVLVLVPGPAHGAAPVAVNVRHLGKDSNVQRVF